MIKEYFKKKSKFSLLLNAITILLLILLIIPATRKDVAGILLKPTRFIHQPKVNSEKPLLSDQSYDWKLESLNGDVIKLKHLKNKVIFINMWATWCPPCIAEMDDMQKLYEEYGEDISFLFVSNEKEEKLNHFLNKKGYTIPVFSPKSNYPKDLETNSLPTTFIISKKGEIIVNKKGLAYWNSRKVKNILDILIKQ